MARVKDLETSNLLGERTGSKSVRIVRVAVLCLPYVR